MLPDVFVDATAVAVCKHDTQEGLALRPGCPLGGRHGSGFRPIAPVERPDNLAQA